MSNFTVYDKQRLLVSGIILGIIIMLGVWAAQ
jgi:hypothetical protein